MIVSAPQSVGLGGIPLLLVASNSGSNAKTITKGDTLGVQYIFNNTKRISLIVAPVSTAVDALFQFPFEAVVNLSEVKKGDKANELCIDFLYIVYGGTSGTRTPIGGDTAKCSHFTFNLPTSIGTNDLLKEATIYPNPVKDRLQIKDLKETTLIELYSIIGQLVHSVPAAMGDVDIDMSRFSNGMYILKMQNGKNIRMEKVQVVN
jgi:hypothetical protein